MNVEIIYYIIIEKPYGIVLFGGANYGIHAFWEINEILKIVEDEEGKNGDLKFIKLIQEYNGDIDLFTGRIYFKSKIDVEKFKEFLESCIVMYELVK